MTWKSWAMVCAVALLGLYHVGAIGWAWRRFVLRPVSSIWRRPSKQDRPGIPAGMRFKVLKRDKFRCVYCGKGAMDGRKLHIDHYTPWKLTKDHKEGTLVVACDRCNLGKGADELEQPIEDFVR